MHINILTSLWHFTVHSNASIYDDITIGYDLYTFIKRGVRKLTSKNYCASQDPITIIYSEKKPYFSKITQLPVSNFPVCGYITHSLKKKWNAGNRIDPLNENWQLPELGQHELLLYQSASSSMYGNVVFCTSSMLATNSRQ